MTDDTNSDETHDEAENTSHESEYPAGSDAHELQQNGVAYARIKFRPEEWVTRAGDDYAEQAGDPLYFVVPLTDLADDDGSLPEERSYEMDALRTHENAPPEAQRWNGPFELYYDSWISAEQAAEINGIERGGAPSDAVTATVTFHPEIPANGQIVEADDTWSFTVPVEDVLDDDGTVLKDNTDASDRLAWHENAPEIVNRWTELTSWYHFITIDAFTDADGEVVPRD